MNIVGDFVQPSTLSEHKPDREYTKDLARFAAELRYDDLSDELITKAIYSIQDCLGLDLYVGTQTDCGRNIAQHALRESGADHTATVIGYGRRATPELAALANGTMGLGFEFEDVHMGAKTHPYATIVPAALGIAERVGSNGHEFIAAVVAGHEIACRIGVASRCRDSDGEHMVWRRGVYTQQVFSVFGAAVAAGKLLGLDPEGIANAMGIAGEQAAGSQQSHDEGTWSRRLHGGLAAANGVRAALLANGGFTGPTHVLEGRYGLYTMFALEFHPDLLMRNLGEEWEFLDVWYKAYPSYTISHAMIESVLKLRKEHNIEPEQVDRVIGFQPRWTQSHLRTDFPTLVSVQYGPRFLLATALLRGKFGLEEVQEETLNDERIHRFARDNVDIVLDEPYTTIRDTTPPPRTCPGGAEIVMKDGRKLKAESLYPLGSPNNPQSRDQMKAKFETLIGASKVLKESETRELYGRIQRLEQDIPVTEVTELLCQQS